MHGLCFRFVCFLFCFLLGEGFGKSYTLYMLCSSVLLLVHHRHHHHYAVSCSFRRWWWWWDFGAVGGGGGWVGGCLVLWLSCRKVEGNYIKCFCASLLASRHTVFFYSVRLWCCWGAGASAFDFLCCSCYWLFWVVACLSCYSFLSLCIINYLQSI